MNIDTTILVVFVTIVLALFAVAFGYGILTNKVAYHEKDIKELKNSFKSIDTKLDAICSDVAVIKSKIENQ